MSASAEPESGPSPRCEYALPACSEAEPELFELAPGHRAACLRLGEIA